MMLRGTVAVFREKGDCVLKKTKPYRGKSFYKLLAAFFAVTLLCSMLMLTQYLANEKTQREETIESYHSMVEKSMKNTESMLSYIEEAGTRIAQLDGMAELATSENIPLGSPEAQHFVRSYLRTVRKTIPATDQPMFLYFQKSGRVFDKSADVDPLESGIVTGLFGMDAATWDQLIQAGEEGTCTIIQDPNMDFARFVYVRQIYPGVVWMIGVNSSRIAEDLSYYYLPEDAQTLFLTANNRSISSANAYGQPGNLPLDFKQVSALPPFSARTWDGQTYFVYHQGFSNNTLQQVIAIPDAGVQEWIVVMAGAIFNTLVVTLLAGGSLSYFFSKTLYRPVEKLVDTLPVKKGSRDESEFQMVASTVQQLSERAKDYETQLHSQSDLLAASLTTRVLKGEIFLSPDIAEALRQGGFPIACQKFVVLILSIDEDADAGSPPIQQEEAGSLLKETCRSFLLNGGFAAYVVADHTSFLGVVGLDSGGLEEVKACAEAIQAFTVSELHMQVSIALSGEHHSLDELHGAYHEATQVADYQLLAGEYGKIATYSRLSSLMSGPNGCREFLAQVNKLSNSIQSANYQQAAALVKEIEESCSKHPAAMPQAKLQISYLTDAILLSLSDSDLDPELLNHLQNAETFRKPRSIDSLCQCTYRIFAYLDAKKEQSRPQGKRIEQITQYIRENYQDINLSAGAVAEHFHISLPVLSNLLKSELNVGFLDYLHKFRIERAKELIVHTDHTIGDISAMVGYANSITMNRAFKRYEGVTPGWYRQSASSHAAAQKGAGDVSP